MGIFDSLFGIGLSTEANWIDTYYGQEAEQGAQFIDGMAKEKRYIAKNTSLVRKWFENLSQYIKSMDCHHHLVSIQFALLDQGNEFWSSDEFDIVLNNAYTNQLRSDLLNKHLEHQVIGVADGMLAWSRFMDHPTKPVLVGEWGGSHMGNHLTCLETELHTGIWAMSMTNLSGVTGFWWANEMDQGELYEHFGSLNAFWHGYDRRNCNLKTQEATILIPCLSLKIIPFAEKLDATSNSPWTCLL